MYEARAVYSLILQYLETIIAISYHSSIYRAKSDKTYVALIQLQGYQPSQPGNNVDFDTVF